MRVGHTAGGWMNPDPGCTEEDSGGTITVVMWEPERVPSPI